MVDKVGFGKRVTVLGTDAKVGGAVLEIDDKKKTDMLFHMDTTKVYFVVLGKVKVNVLRDGKVHSIVVGTEQSFEVNPGLVFQLEGMVAKSLLVEFSSNPAIYVRDKEGKYPNDDSRIISKGTLVVDSAPAPVATKQPVGQSLPQPKPIQQQETTPAPAVVVEPPVKEEQEPKMGRKQKNKKGKRKGK